MRAAVEGDACLILRFVSLEGMRSRREGWAQGVPVEIGGFDETEALWFGRGNEYDIGGDKFVRFETDNVADANVFPFA